MAWFALRFGVRSLEALMIDRMIGDGIEELSGDTSPDTNPTNDLVDALEWLKRAGVVSGERPPFAGFFEEIAGEPSEP
jgi:hypothetical protein